MSTPKQKKSGELINISHGPLIVLAIYKPHDCKFKSYNQFE